MSVVTLLLGGCVGKAPESAPHRPSLVLVTFNGLRADMVEGLGGRRGLTPHLDRLLGQSDWAGRAIAPSSSTLLSGASLFTGLQPWKHGVVHEGAGPLPEHLVTLTDVLLELGYKVEAHRSNYWLDQEQGFGRDVGPWWPLRDGSGAFSNLREMECSSEAYWIDMDLPTAPYRLFPNYLSRLDALGPEVVVDGLPRRVRFTQLAEYLEPRRRLPPRLRQEIFSLYALGVARSDEILGQVMDAVSDAGCWNEVVFAVVSVRGEEFGEYGQVAGGGSLRRHLIEVPMAVRLPTGGGSPDLASARRAAPAAPLPGRAPGTVRLFATLVEAVGGTPPPASAPSLFRNIADGVLSELYLLDGYNQLSWVEGDRQVIWERRFGERTQDFYTLRLGLGVDAAADAALSGVVAAFAGTDPLGTVEEARIRAQRWDDQATPTGDITEELSMEASRELASRLERAWVRANGDRIPVAPAPPPVASAASD
jgi:hypothetical protein